MISESLSSAEAQSNGKEAEESLVEERWKVSSWFKGEALRVYSDTNNNCRC
jgi:hypothetical protein